MQLDRSLLPSRALILFVTAVCLLAGCKAKPAESSAALGATSPATPAPPAAADRQVDFVKSFYAYYDPMIHGKDGSSNTAIDKRPELFAAPLLAALRNDQVIQAKSKGEINGLDADPFGYGQDPSSVDDVKVTGSTGDRVHVQTFYQQKQNGALDMQVQCAGRCQLVNVFYPANPDVPGYDLLGQLKLLHPAK